jgi:hypothetical protein
MLHAGMLAPGADRLVERVLAAYRAEGAQIAGAEPFDGLGLSVSAVPLLRWLSGSKRRMLSSSSPKKSRRRGWSSPGGKTSTMLPRRAYSPGSPTVSARR